MIKVELVNQMVGRDYQSVEPDDIIYLNHERDMSYDRASEDMGYFLTLVYLKDGGEVVAELYNPGNFEPIKELIEKCKDVLEETPRGFLNKNRTKDIRIKDDSLIYQDKYKISLDNN